MIYGEPPRPPIDKERSLRVSPPTMQPPIQAPPPPQSQTSAPPLQVEPTRFSCTLPIIPPPILTPPMPLASEGVRLLTHPSSNFMLPSTFQRGGAQMNTTANNPTTDEEQIKEVRDTRTVTLQDSYDELTPSSSKSEPMGKEPSRLVGFQKDPKLQERQRQQQRVESKTTNAATDLRNKLNAGKRAREQGEPSSSRANRGAPAPSPTQPESRKQKVVKKWLTTTEMQQLDIAISMYFQREVPATTV